MSLGEPFEEVLEAAKQGAEWAWVSLYRELAGPVTGYLAARGAPEPEDVAAETFLQVARNVQSFSGNESSFRSWVFVIAHRRLIDSRRAWGRRPDVTALAGQGSDQIGGDAESEAVDQLVTEELRAAFDRLTEDQRDVLALRIIANLTLEETANAIGKRLGAVKAIQRRGLIALRDQLDLEAVTR
ncbi:MAG TPA: RNA polymerase sigma factor [Acidimicrobiia bacterium]|jgi:RNA polymerase sigma-70 factor (ECF subfamily)